MVWLLLGLLLFLGVHSVRIVAEGWRGRSITRWGEARWKAGYTVLAVLGLVLIVVGYGQARQSPVLLWAAPLWARHLAGLGVLLALVLLAAAQVPGNAIKARLRHPMVLGVKLWALAHLMSNNTLADLLLFGSFLVWAVLDFRAARARDRAQPPAPLPTRAGATALTVVAGLGVWLLLAFGGHAWLFGVRPFG